MRRLSEYDSVLVERPTRETQAEQHSDTVLEIKERPPPFWAEGIFKGRGRVVYFRQAQSTRTAKFDPRTHESAHENAHGSVHEDVHGNAHEG